MPVRSRGLVDQFLPSMFARRLALLAVGVGLCFSVLMGQMVRLTMAEAAAMREEVESALVQHRLIPTVRGKLYDRHGRLLATDRPSYDVTVHYRVITGEWAYQMARREAYRRHREGWAERSTREKLELTARYEPAYQQQLDELWQALAHVGRISPEELRQKRDTIVRRVQQVVADVSLRHQRRRQKRQQEPVPYEQIKVREQTIRHPLLKDQPESRLAQIRRLVAAAEQPAEATGPDPRAVWREVAVEDGRTRDYPKQRLTIELDRSTFPTPLAGDDAVAVEVAGVGIHLLGDLREVWREDVEAHPFDLATAPDGYLDGDLIGRWGIEETYETRLRGQRGYVTRYLDTNEHQRQEPVPGEDLQLSLDVNLQARIQAAMRPEFGLTVVQPYQHSSPPQPPQAQIGEPLAAAAVVIEIHSGQVLAAVSHPGFTHRQLAEEPDTVWGNERFKPYMNRALQRAYQPGSVVKPLVWTAAVSEGKIAANGTIDCKGYYFPGKPNQFRDWIYKHYGRSFGTLDAAGAIARSSNYFFYTLGDRLGAQRLARWYRHFGLGRVSGSGMAGEVAGDLPDPDRADEPGVKGFSRADSLFLSIGQGPIRWTPLQAAAAYAALARGGTYLSPSFLTEPDWQHEHWRHVDLEPHAASLGPALEGLHQAVSRSHGTAHHLTIPGHGREPIFNVDGVRLYGKSGTAQAAPQRVDGNDDGRITGEDPVVRTGDHAWFAGLAQKPGSPQPEYAIVVVVEHGGSGGKVAGPIANQVVHALKAEGYL